MADYARIRVGVEVSEQSDYGRPYVDAALEMTTSPDEVINEKLECDTGGTTRTTSYLTSISKMMIENLDSTNYVDVTHRSAANSSTDNKTRLAAGDLYVTSDVTASGNLTFTANTAAVKVRLIVLGT